METKIKLTLLFEGMFWVGVFEKQNKDAYEVSKVVFGSEPKDYEVYDYVLKNYNNLKFLGAVKLKAEKEKTINPKRLQRKIKTETKTSGIGTKAQNALKLLQEKNKLQRKVLTREEKERQKERKFKLRQEKKLGKHKGH